MEQGYNVQILRERRKELRKRETLVENCLWQSLRKNKLGVKFYRQYSVRNYILDFYCPSVRVAIELDGKHHEEENVKLNDEGRTKFLEAQDIIVLRFKNEEVLKNMDVVLEEIKKPLVSPLLM